jgi:hypothetical protein
VNLGAAARARWRRLGGALIAALGLASALQGQSIAAAARTPNLGGCLEQPLRYHPDAGDFVIENGAEFFNRPLYGPNDGFRVDAGDRPEFVLYLPGRGGNLRLGFRTERGARWLHEAASITARYRPGEMVYDLCDPALGAGATVRVTALPLDRTDGLGVRIETTGAPNGTELVFAFGGANGQRGRRDGDIGTETVPISQYFHLRPEVCAGDQIELGANQFTLRSAAATLGGGLSAPARLARADATLWNDLPALLANARTSGVAPADAVVVVGRVPVAAGSPLFLVLQRVGGQTRDTELDTYRAVATDRTHPRRDAPVRSLAPAYAPIEVPAVFAAAETSLTARRARVSVATPDPYLDAAVSALNVAADAVWDEAQGAVMHGAVAWRTRLLGWRGPYALDALGWHERARRHFRGWAAGQNVDPIPAAIPSADEATNLARNEAALHSNGDLSHSHYDMNLVYVDALLRHLRWTGDWELARELWPLLERHLAWERRLFRREFGPERLPLYEAYAAIWASDDLQYHGGGVTYASAYNCFHERTAAEIATHLGQDPGSFRRESDRIRQAMHELLWLDDRGAFAEFKDYLGRQAVHPSAGIWSYYHPIDSECVTPEEAWRMTLACDTQLPRLPLRGPGVPADAAYAVFASTDWMPYTWSANNVVMGENLHAALAYWQAGRPEAAYRLTQSALLASMFMGICPGNVGTMNYLDVYRRESQRDFADGGGVLARTLVEGLFGVRPDLLAGELRLVPGFPASWDHAGLTHPDLKFEFRRAGREESYRIELRSLPAQTLRLQLHPRGTECEARSGGQKLDVRWLDRGKPWQLVEVVCPLGPTAEITVTWAGAPAPAEPETRATESATTKDGGLSGRRLPESARLETVDLRPYFNDRVTGIFRHEYRAPRAPFCSLAIPKQGIGGWAGEVNASAEIDDSGLRAAAAGGEFQLPGGLKFATPGPGSEPNIAFTSQWDPFPREVSVPLTGRARRVHLLMAGSTNWMQSRFENGEVVASYADGSTARLALVNPVNWWPIEQDYFIDDFQFHRPEGIPPRINLKTGEVRFLNVAEFKGRGGRIPGGAATVLELELDPRKDLHALTVRALANEVVIGLMAATLER